MQKLSGKAKEGLLCGAFMLCVLVFLLVFFLAYRPLILDNMDDWTYISFSRAAVPLWDSWNPSKVLPEILMPACAQLAVWFVLPVAGDYVLSLTIVYNVFFSLIIALYIGMFLRLLMRRISIGAALAAMISALFLVFHFRSWMSPWIPSQHVFYSGCVVTAYNYTVPALLNMILVLHLQTREPDCADRPLATGFLVILLYLAVFSNLFSSIVIAAYASYCLLEGFVIKLLKRKSMRQWLRESVLYISILLSWLVSMVYELSGGRAASMASEEPLLDRLKETVSILLDVIERMEDTVFYLSLGVIAVGVVLLVLSGCRKEEDQSFARMLIRNLFCSGVTLLYLLLLSAVVEKAYINRMDVLICVMFYVFSAVFISMAYILKKWKRAAVALPLVTFVIAFDVLLGIQSFAYSSTLALPPDECMAINQAFMQQILEADEAGMHEMTLIVPEGNSQMGNWPYSYNMGLRMVNSLKSHEMIKHIDRIVIEPDAEFFTKFNIR